MEIKPTCATSILIQKNSTHTEINCIPDELLIYIFSFLNQKELQENVRLTCRKFKILAEDNTLWKNIIDKKDYLSALDDFESLVEEDFMKWYEVFHFRTLSDLFSQVFNGNFRSCFKDYPHSEVCECRKYRRYGNTRFEIHNDFDIEMRVKDIEGEIVFKDNEKKPWIALDVEGRFLFALREDGVVIQWDYLIRRVVRKIESSDDKNDLMSIIVKDGYIKVGYYPTDPYKRRVCAELFSYRKPEYHSSIDLEGCFGITMKNHLIYIFKILPNFKSQIEVHNLESQEIVRIIQPKYLDTKTLNIQNDILCGTTPCGSVYLIDQKKNKEIRYRDFNPSKKNTSLGGLLINGITWGHTAMIGNLLLGYVIEHKMENPPSRKGEAYMIDTLSLNRISIINLNTWKIEGEFDGLFDFENHSIDPKVLRKLILCCREHLAPLIKTRKSKKLTRFTKKIFRK